MKWIEETLDFWARKHWFAIVDLRETDGMYTKAIATFGTHKMPLFLSMIEELDAELREGGFTLALVRPTGENLAELHIWNDPRGRKSGVAVERE